MGLSSSQVGELVRELVPLVEGAEVRGIQAVPPRDLLLALVPADPTRGALLRVRFSADPEAARVHLQVGPVRRHEGPSDPFFARLESALDGTVLRRLEQVQGDRVVRAAFARDGVPAATLVAELTGRHANLLLLDRAGCVAEVLVAPAATSPASARLAVGAAYALPPGRRGAPGPGEPDVSAAFPAPPAGGALAALAPLSARVEAALGHAAEERFDEELRRELVRRLERRLERAEALIRGLEERARAGAEAERVRMDAELLLAHLGQVPRGAREVSLPDSFLPDSPPRCIALDPGLAPRRNAEKLFARYKKLLRTLARLPEELAHARTARDELVGWIERARSEAPVALEAAAVAAGVLQPVRTAPEPRRRATIEPRLPYIRFLGLRGGEIRVGRNAQDNDRLTFREARGNDLWLHTADSPGSHVVLRLERGAEPDAEELLDAAHLAVHFSPLRGAARADVHVARQKEVKKPRKAPPGLVTLSGGKVIRLRLEPARLERLLRNRASGGPEPSGPGT